MLSSGGETDGRTLGSDGDESFRQCESTCLLSAVSSALNRRMTSRVSMTVASALFAAANSVSDLRMSSSIASCPASSSSTPSPSFDDG